MQWIFLDLHYWVICQLISFVISLSEKYFLMIKIKFHDFYFKSKKIINVIATHIFQKKVDIMK